MQVTAMFRRQELLWGTLKLSRSAHDDPWWARPLHRLMAAGFPAPPLSRVLTTRACHKYLMNQLHMFHYDDIHYRKEY